METILTDLTTNGIQNEAIFSSDGNELLNFETGKTVAIAFYNSLGWVKKKINKHNTNKQTNKYKQT